MFGFFLKMRSSLWISFLTTWISLHALVSFWYLSMLSMASNLVASTTTIAYYSLCVNFCSVMRRLWCFIYFGSIASP